MGQTAPTLDDLTNTLAEALVDKACLLIVNDRGDGRTWSILRGRAGLPPTDHYSRRRRGSRAGTSPRVPVMVPLKPSICWRGGRGRICSRRD